MKLLIILFLLITACNNTSKPKEVMVPIDSTVILGSDTIFRANIQKSDTAKRFVFKVDDRTVDSSVIIQNKSK